MKETQWHWEHSIKESVSKDRSWADFGKKNKSRYSISENSQEAPFVIGDRRNVIKEWNEIISLEILSLD